MADKLTQTFTIQKWSALRDRLSNKTLLTDDWKDAIKLLKERVYERYFNPLKILIDNSENKGEGFTILTIECALVEFLATLEDGRIFKRNKLPTDKHCYYRRSAKIYQKFLRTTAIFDRYFYSSTGEKPLFTPYDFYLNVRCALIHEAQTREKWEVKIYKTNEQDKVNEICFDQTSDGKKLVYRTALYKKLVEYFNSFVTTQLTQENDRGKTLRKHLARKIDHLAEVNPDKKFWWD